MKRRDLGDSYPRSKRRHSSTMSDSEQDDSCARSLKKFTPQPRKALLRRPSPDISRISQGQSESDQFRRGVKRYAPQKFAIGEHSSNINSKYSEKKTHMNLSTARSFDRSKPSFPTPLSRVDPVFAAAAAAAVMNAGLMHPPISGDFPHLPFQSSGSSNSSSAAAVAAVAAAAMNAAAMAAALGVGPSATSTKQMSQVTRSIMGSNQNSNYRSLFSSSNRSSRLCSNTSQTSSGSRAPRMTTQVHKQDKESSYGSFNPRFPHHLDHRDPEDDPTATRTLFVGNLLPDITEGDLRILFERYGLIEDIDIKRREPESGVNAYAFVRFVNLDMAHRAKVDMSGQMIGQFTCKIGYGKVVPTRCLWIGGLGPWITYPAFATLLNEFGPPERIIWPSGKNYANVLFFTVEQAVVAADTLRGYPLGGNDRRIRVDFTDESHMVHDPLLSRRKSNNPPVMSSDHVNRKEFVHARMNRDSLRVGHEERSTSLGKRSRRDHKFQPDIHDEHMENSSQSFRSELSHRTHRSTRETVTPKRRNRNSSEEEVNNTSVSHRAKSPPQKLREASVSIENALLTAETASNIEQLAACLPTAWDGAFFLKSSNFPCRMHILRGDQNLVDQFMSGPVKRPNSSVSDREGSKHTSSTKDGECIEEPDQLACLHITQRMKLDPIKLEDVSQRINTAGNSGFCVLLAVPSPNPVWNQSHISHSDNTDVQKQPQRPLRNLIAYLRTKDSAGVVLLNPLQAGSGSANTSLTADGLPITGVLHAFPPCDFAFDLLSERAVHLQKEYTKDDHLVILLIRSTGTL